MTPVPLGELRLWPSHLLSALWWLRQLYLWPKYFEFALNELPKPKALLSVPIVVVLSLPFIVAFCFFVRLFVFAVLGLTSTDPPASGEFFHVLRWHVAWISCGIGFGIGYGTAVGIVLGIALGSLVGITLGTALGIAVGIALGIALGSPGGIVLGFPLALAVGTAVGIFLEGPLLIAYGIVVGTSLVSGVRIAHWIVSGIAVGIAVGIGVRIAVGVAMNRSYYLLMHPIWLWPHPRAAWYRYHPVVWGDKCGVPFPGLHRLLVALKQREPELALSEIERLVETYPSQRIEALKARALLIAELAGACQNIADLDEQVCELPEGSVGGFLLDGAKAREGVAAIAHRQLQMDNTTVLATREVLAAQLLMEIQSFRDRAGGFAYPLNEGFRAAAAKWLLIAEQQWTEARALLATAPTAQVFRAGDPVDSGKEAFVPRLPVIEELQGQITLATGCPGILLYGRRRTGKSTLLKNLQPYLPTTIEVRYLSMQEPALFGSLEGLCARLSSAVGSDGKAHDLATLDAGLRSADARLGQAGHRIIVAIDEYENIDNKIGEGVFPTDLLDLFRHSIQEHRHIIWLFAGSHGIEELAHAEWPSWFVSLRTSEICPFTPTETRLLLTEPLKSSQLYRGRDEARPRFDAGFWGECGIDRIHAEAAGWPHLVQLLAEMVVELVNLRGLKCATPALLEEAAQKSIVRGENVLIQLVRNESRLPGEWDYLRRFRQVDAQPPPTDEAVYTSLRRRLMVAEEGGQWRMRVPLMQRWLRERG